MGEIDIFIIYIYVGGLMGNIYIGGLMEYIYLKKLKFAAYGQFVLFFTATTISSPPPFSPPECFA